MGERRRRDVAMVIGGSGALGSACARRLAERGSVVVVTYHRGAERADALVDDICRAGGTACAYALDVTSVPDARAGFRRAAELGRVHAVVNAAGRSSAGWGLTTSLSGARDLVEVNGIGALNVVQCAYRAMRGSGGVVVNLCSAAGHRCAPGQAAYGASKAFAHAVTAGCAVEARRRGVQVVNLDLGIVDVGLAATLDPDVANRFACNLPLGRAASADEVAAAVAFIVSTDGHGLTGHGFPVDGGASALTGMEET